jgi:large subunit ribosomal protein L3
MNTLFGTKGTMTQTFIEGFRIPVTKVTLGPCVVTQIKNNEKDGYWAVQLGFGTKKIKNTSKALQGHVKKSQDSKETKAQPRYLREVRVKSEPKYNVGDVVTAGDIFKKGDVVSVTAVNKGKGFAGGVRRFNFRGGPKTHGQSDRHRAPGSIGQTTTPGRVYKGKRMAGRMGGVQVTIKNVHVVAVNKETNEILISSPIPGRVGIFLTVNRIKAGSLKDLEHEVVATVVEGESTEPQVAETVAESAAVLEETK